MTTGRTRGQTTARAGWRARRPRRRRSTRSSIASMRRASGTRRSSFDFGRRAPCRRGRMVRRIGRGSIATGAGGLRLSNCLVRRLNVDELQARLDDLRDRGLYRKLRLISGPQGPRVLLDGKPVLLLCSNNYLGLADHPRTPAPSLSKNTPGGRAPPPGARRPAADAAMRWGAGAGASRLVSGNMTIHRRLEERLPGGKGCRDCPLFVFASL